MAYPFAQFDTRTLPAAEGYVPSFLSKLPFARRSSKGTTGGYRKPPANQHVLETLEPRVLLAADLSFGAATDLTLLSSAFFAAGSAFLEEIMGLTDESEDEEDASDDTLVLVFDEESGEFYGSESEETSDDGEWVIDDGGPEPDEDVYALLSLDDEDFTALVGLSIDGNKSQSGSRINWDSRYAS